MRLGTVQTSGNVTELQIYQVKGLKVPRNRKKPGPRHKRAASPQIVTDELAALPRRRRYEIRQLKKGLCKTGCGNKLNQWKYRCDACQKKEHTKWKAKNYAKGVIKKRPISEADQKRYAKKSRENKIMARLSRYERLGWDVHEMLIEWKKTRDRFQSKSSAPSK